MPLYLEATDAWDLLGLLIAILMCRREYAAERRAAAHSEWLAVDLGGEAGGA